MKSDEKEGGGHGWQPRTLAVRAGLSRSPFQETSEAIYLTSGYAYDSAEQAAARFAGEDEGFIYSRYDNPTVRVFEQRLAALEGAEACYAAASGMAAIFATFAATLSAGDHIVLARQIFGAINKVIGDHLSRFGIGHTFVDAGDLDAWRAAIRPNTKMLFLETPANPTLDVFDIAAVADIAHEAGALLVVDNVFATPVLQNPLKLGADVVVHSATKHIDGQGRVLGGAVLGSRDFIDETIRPFMRQTGASLSPFNAWVLLKGLETLQLRVRAMSDTALQVARFLREKLGPQAVRYPGLEEHPQHALARKQMKAGGTMLAFELPGGRETAFRFLNGLKLIDISNNLGDAKSLITHPASTTHSVVPEEERLKQGIREGLVRLSVGLEHALDIIGDIAGALALAGVLE